MKGAVELMVKLLLLLWIHSMVECRPITCPLARNFVKYGPNGEIVECRPCPECAEGHGLSIQCGSQIANDSKIECVSCELNKTYSDSHGIGSCRTCQYCGLRNVIQQCSPSQNRRCGNKCPKGYFFDDNFNDCLEVKSEIATTKSTEPTPTVRQDLDHSTTTKRHLKTEAYEDTIAISRHSVQIKPSSIQPRHSSLVVGITPTATPNFGTTKVPFLTENNDTASVLLTKKVQHEQKDRMLLTIIIIVLVAVAVLLLSVLLIITVYRARHPRTQPELRDSAEEIPLNSIDEREDSSDATINSFTTQDDLTVHGSLDKAKELITPADISSDDLTDHASPDKAKELLTPADISADIRTNEVSPNAAVDKLNLANIPEGFPVSGMEQLCDENRGNMFCFVQRKLDAVETLTTKTWRSIGRTLKLSADILNLIEADYRAGLSPTESLVTNLKTSGKEPTMREFVQALKNCKRYDVANYICNWPWEKLVATHEGQDQSVRN